MSDLQKLLKDYDVDFEPTPNVPPAIRKSVEVEYTYRLEEMHRTKPTMLIRHDVDSLSHVKRQIAQRAEHWVILTWDKVMISVGRKDIECGWVVSPEIALDFVQPYKPLSDVDLCTVAHRIARLRERPNSLTAQIIDRVVEIAGEDLQDWELRSELADFKDDLLTKIDFSKAGYSDWAETQTDKFLEKRGYSTDRKGKKEVEVQSERPPQSSRSLG